MQFSKKSHFQKNFPQFHKIVLKLTQDKITHLLYVLNSSQYPTALKQATRQPENPNQFVNFRFVVSHCYCKTKSEALRKSSLVLQTAIWTFINDKVAA